MKCTIFKRIHKSIHFCKYVHLQCTSCSCMFYVFVCLCVRGRYVCPCLSCDILLASLFATAPTGSATYIMNFMHKAECQHGCIIFAVKC